MIILTFADSAAQILTMVIGQRQRVIEATDGSSSRNQLNSEDEDEDAQAAVNRLRDVSNEAMAKFEDYRE